MGFRKYPKQLLFALSCILLATGIGLAIVFEILDFTFEGPLGIVIAALLGTGICLQVFTLIRYWLPESILVQPASISMSGENLRVGLGNRQLRHAKLTILFSAVSGIVAVILYVVGVFVAFTNFNFASGTNDAGLLIMLASLAVGFIAAVSNLVGIAFGWMSWRSTGVIKWFMVATLIPVFLVTTFLLVFSFL